MDEKKARLIEINTPSNTFENGIPHENGHSTVLEIDYVSSMWSLRGNQNNKLKKKCSFGRPNPDYCTLYVSAPPLSYVLSPFLSFFF